MKARTLMTVLLLALLVTAGAILTSKHFERVRNEGPRTTQAGTELRLTASPLILTAAVTLRDFTNRVSWIGTVQSQSSVELKATLSGFVESIGVEDEMAVEKGALLFQLGGAPIESERARRENAVESLNSQQLLASQTVERVQEDLKVNLATKDELAAARQSEIALLSQLHAAQLTLDSFRQQTRIAAPIAGVFTSRRLSAGQQVNPGDTLAEILDPSRLRIVASVFPPQGVDLQEKQAAIQKTEHETIFGTVRRVLAQASDTGATVVWIEGPEIDENLRPGQNVSGNLTLAAHPSTPAVPETAVVYDSQEQPFVFVSHVDTYEKRSVRVGLASDGWLEIVSGLEQGESVVTQGAYELFYRQFNEQFKVRD